MRRILWCVLAAFACGPASRGPVGESFGVITHYDTRRVEVIEFTPEVRRGLTVFYEEAQAELLEAIACLYGYRRGNDVVIDRWIPGVMLRRSSHAVLFATGTSGCPDDAGLVGTFHTHLVHPVLGVNRNASIPDRVSFFTDPRVMLMLIGTGPDTANGIRLVVFWTLRHGTHGYMVWP